MHVAVEIFRHFLRRLAVIMLKEESEFGNYLQKKNEEKHLFRTEDNGDINI